MGAEVEVDYWGKETGRGPAGPADQHLPSTLARGLDRPKAGPACCRPTIGAAGAHLPDQPDLHVEAGHLQVTVAAGPNLGLHQACHSAPGEKQYFASGRGKRA